MNTMKMARFLVLGVALVGCGGASPVGPVDGQAADADAGASEVDTSGQAGKDASSIETAAGACGNHTRSVPALYMHSVGLAYATAYKGPAVVERSTDTDLVLAFSSEDADAGAPSTTHTTIQGPGPMPMFPLGAKVWLEKSTPSFNGFGPPLPWIVAVRDKKDGHLIMGAGKEPAREALLPYEVSATGKCTGRYDDECASGMAVYSSLVVHGDTDVTIADGETRTVRAGGVDYDVSVMARDVEATVPSTCADYSIYEGIALEVRAKDPATLIAALEVGAPIACARGNDVARAVGYSFYSVALGTPYDGKAFYMKRTENTPGADCFQFSVVGVTSAVPPETPVLELCAPTGLFPEPTVGQEFWATLSSYDMIALRGPNRGPLLLAGVSAAVPFDADTSTRLAQVLGVPAQARPACAYAQAFGPGTKVDSLWEVAVGATTPGIIKTDAHTVVPIAGKSYDAWMSGVGSQVYFSLVAQK